MDCPELCRRNASQVPAEGGGVGGKRAPHIHYVNKVANPLTFASSFSYYYLASIVIAA